MNQIQTVTQQMDLELSLDPLDDFVRVPGLLRRWEIEQVVTSGAEYRIEEAGETSDKTQVFAVYRRERPRLEEAEVGVPVTLSFDGEAAAVRARLLPIHGDDPLMAILVIGDNPDDAAVLARVRDHLVRSGQRPAAAPVGPGATSRPQEGASP